MKLIRLLQRLPQKLLFKHMLMYISLVILVIITVGFITYFYIISEYRTQTLDYTMKLLEKSNHTIEDGIKKINVSTTLLFLDYNNDESFLRLLINEDNGQTINRIQKIQKFDTLSAYINEMFKGINSIFAIKKNQNVLYYGKSNYNPVYDFFEDKDFRSVVESKSKELQILDKELTKNYLTLYNKNIISICRNVFDPDDLEGKQVIATFMINLDSDFFADAFSEDYFPDGSNILILNSGGKIIYSNDSKLIGSDFSSSGKELFGKTRIKGNFTTAINGKRQVICYFHSVINGWIFAATIPESQLNKSADIMRKYFVLILVIYILIGFLVSFSFGRRLSRHIKKIVKAMQDVEKGNLSTQVDIKTNDELKLISNGLNKMILKINENIREIYSTEARKREAELYALKSQIDPHFLFNILEVVRMRNIVSGDGETARMVKKLGQFYQAKLDYNEDLIDLKDEIEMMKKYIEIEIFRRKEKLELDIEIDSRFWACKIPIFTFQPLIENVLRHGTVKDRDIKITVSAAVIGDKVEITISDNGCGIKNEKLLEINSEINEQVIKKSYKHMGVKNVNYRLKLYFGLQYGITMESIYGDGTTIKLYLPWNGEGSNV